MDQAIEDKVKFCHTCQVNQNAPAKAPLHPWEWPERPWSRIHIDHAGPYHNQLWLIIVDAHSKWLDIYPVSSTNSQTTIDMLRVSFSNQGLPEMIVSDNAASFTSAQFAEFCDNNGIHHVTSAPYHTASNGLAERAVQSLFTLLHLVYLKNGDHMLLLDQLLYHDQTLGASLHRQVPPLNLACCYL